MNLNSNRRNWLRVIIGAVLLSAALFAFWVSVDSDNLYWLFHSRLPAGPQSSGASVPLPTILAIAEREADKIDPEAVLVYGTVHADPPTDLTKSGYTGPITGSLQFNFDYVQPNGGYFWIYIEDAAPEATLYVYSRHANDKAQGRNYTRDISLQYGAALSRAKISPRDAVQATWDEAQQEAAKANASNMSLEPTVYFSSFGNNAVGKWSVAYWLRAIGPTTAGATPTPVPELAQGEGTGSRALFSSEGLMTFTIDSVTGEILSRDYYLFPRPTPTP